MGRLTSENRPQRGQFLTDLQAHSPAMGQKDSEKWTAAVDLQPTIPKFDRLLDQNDHADLQQHQQHQRRQIDAANGWNHAPQRCQQGLGEARQQAVGC